MQATIRAFHYPSYIPLFEVSVAPSSTIGALKLRIAEVFAESETCVMRIFEKWYLETQLGSTKTMVEIKYSHEDLLMTELGIEDYTPVYLEGPLVESMEDIARTVAISNFQARRQGANLSEQLHRLAEEQSSMMGALNKLASTVQEMADRQVALEEGQQQLTGYSKQIQVLLATNEAKIALDKNPNAPMKALWTVLNNRSLTGVEAALAIVHDGSCGLEKQSTNEEDKFASHSGYSLGHGSTPLMLAFHADRLDVARALIAEGANVAAADALTGATLLSSACSNGNTEAVELLLAKGCSLLTTDNDGNGPLHRASVKGHEAVMRLILAKGAPVAAANKSYSSTALHWTAQHGQLKASQILLEHGLSPNVPNKDANTPLHVAALFGHKSVCQLLIAKGASVRVANNLGNTPIHWAAQNGHAEVIIALVARGADVDCVNIEGNTPLHSAIFKGHRAAVQTLVYYGASINIPNAKMLSTPLHWAANYGHPEVLDFLINAGADPMAVNKDGGTPLHQAAYSGNTHSIKVLIDNKVPISPQNTTFASTPLHWAAQYNKPAAIDLLILNGADVNEMNKDNNTPLQLAAMNGHLAAIEVLLQRGSNIHTQNKKGAAPIRNFLGAGEAKCSPADAARIKELLSFEAKV